MELWWRESSYNPRARNRRSGAMGLAGMRRRAWRDVGLSPSWNPHRQAQAFFLYVDRHPIYRGDPGRALASLRRRGSY